MVHARLVCALALVMTVVACADGDQRTSLAELIEQQQARDGDVVVVKGTVDMAEEPLHYWITDGEAHHVGLRPLEAVEDHVGERVTVRGRFSYSRDRGRWIEIETINVRAESGTY